MEGDWSIEPHVLTDNRAAISSVLRRKISRSTNAYAVILMREVEAYCARVISRHEGLPTLESAASGSFMYELGFVACIRSITVYANALLFSSFGGGKGVAEAWTSARVSCGTHPVGTAEIVAGEDHPCSVDHVLEHLPPEWTAQLPTGTTLDELIDAGINLDVFAAEFSLHSKRSSMSVEALCLILETYVPEAFDAFTTSLLAQTGVDASSVPHVLAAMTASTEDDVLRLLTHALVGNVQEKRQRVTETSMRA